MFSVRTTSSCYESLIEFTGPANCRTNLLVTSTGRRSKHHLFSITVFQLC